MLRILEITLTCMLILIFSPLLMMIALLIVIDSGLPILYLSPRIGKEGKPFDLFYFRTMESDSKPPDECLTKVGRFLRRYSLDHLPQLFNLLQGNMHFVGPRPMRPEQADLENPYYRQTLRVKPGVFSPAIIQLGKAYNESEFTTKISLEQAFLDERTPARDVRFVLDALIAFIKSQGNVKMHGKPRVDVNSDFTDNESAR